MSPQVVALWLVLEPSADPFEEEEEERAAPEVEQEPAVTEPAPQAVDEEPAPIVAERREELDREPEPEPKPEPKPQLQPEPEVAVAQQAEEPRPRFRRYGLMLAFSTGLAGCGQLPCSLIAVGGLGRIELGYRLFYVAPFVGLSGGGAPIDVDEYGGVADDPGVPDANGRVGFLDVGAGVQVFPVKKGRVDPFLVGMLGYSRFAIRGEGYDEYLSRGAVRVGGGLSIFVNERLAIGPRFDIVFGFAGKNCVEIDGVDIDEPCVDVRDAIDEQESTVAERIIRRELPKVWSLTFDLRVYF